MLIEIDNHSGIPIYRQILDQIRSHVLTGREPYGFQLPSVRDLAARLKVNPMTVSKAYSFLEAEGIVERKRGVGLFVTKVSQSRKDRTKAQMLESILKKAAETAIELSVGEKQAVKMFTNIYRLGNPQKGRQK